MREGDLLYILSIDRLGQWDFYNEKNNTIVDKFYELFGFNSTFCKVDYAHDDNFIDGRRFFHMSKLVLTESPRDGDSVRMFDIIMDGLDYDFAVINTSVIGNPYAIMLNSMRRLGGNFATQYAANKNNLDSSLETLLELYKNA